MDLTFPSRAALLWAGVALMTPAVFGADSWPMFGQNPANTAANATETTIGIKTVATLKPKWTLATGGDVSARAAVKDGTVYFPDWGGNLWAVDSQSGKALWSHQLSDYFPGAAAGTIQSRTSPAIANGLLYVGTQQGAYLLAIYANTGQLAWKTQLESADTFAIVTSSPVVFEGEVYAGVASLAEGASLVGSNLSTYVARGSVEALNAQTGHIDWKTYMVPHGYTGGAVWGSNFVVDEGRGTVFVSTGDNYNHPAPTAPSSKPGMNFRTCLATDTEAHCLSADDHVDSIVALDRSTGKVKWAQKMVNWGQAGVTNGSDDWNFDCEQVPLGTECPTDPGPDYDFGSAPNEITYQTAKGPRTIIGAGQKSGLYYALDPDTGAILWRKQVGPGSSLGGIMWGSASDGKRIYVAIANYNGIPFHGGSAGSWAALDPANGNVLWQTADPNGAVDFGPLSVANGVVYAASMAGTATAPNLFALDASTGDIIWSYAAGASVNAGASIVDGVVYWGSGYANLGIPGFTGSFTTGVFYAFSSNGK